MLFVIGLRATHSTPQSLIYLINKIALVIHEGQVSAGIFLDLSKAFDTLDPDILFSKLEHYCLRELALKWIRSYFSKRDQFKETCSSTQQIKCGVPQSSILGHLFFVLYINDIPNAITQTDTLLFTDTSIYVAHSDINQVQI